MRYRLMATYQGVPYEAGIGPSDEDVVLFAACPPPEELGFEPATGHWRKQLHVQDVQALWESKPMGTYRGQRCMVLDDLGDRLHIAYLGHDAYQAQQLGYWQVDRGVFELVTARDEVTDVAEERSDYATEPAGRADGQYPAGDYDPATADYGPAAGYGQPGTDYGPVTADYGPLTTDDGLATAGRGPATADFGPAVADYGPAATDPGVSTPSGLAPGSAPPDSGTLAPPGGPPVPPPDFGTIPPPSRRPGPLPGQPPSPLSPGFTVIPSASQAPLPLEAAALRAASAAARPERAYRASQVPQPAQFPLTAPTLAGQDLPARNGSVATQAPPATHAAPVAEAPPPAIVPPAAHDLLAGPDAPAAAAPAGTVLAAGAPAAVAPVAVAPAGIAPAAEGLPAAPELPAHRRRRSARSRMATRGIFIELATLAAIPPAAYAVGEEVDGALCLIETAAGYEVFSAAGGARHEVRAFEDEESAYFYLFGVLAAEAVRTGLLIPRR
jgi:hypothetical protein